MSYGADFIFTTITNDPRVAARADAAGINCIGLDFEIIGKKERQKAPGAWISDHTFEQIGPVREALSHAKLFARTNPLHEQSKEEVERLIEEGVQVLMFPMFRTSREVGQFVELVDGRAEISLLLETPEAMFRVEDICRIDGIHEITAGLNDLHIALGLNNHFEILVSDLFQAFCNAVNTAGIRLGFGTIGRLNNESLAIPPDLIIAQYPRLNAISARLFRHFLGPDPLSLDMSLEVEKIRQRLNFWHGQDATALQRAREMLNEVCRGEV